MADATTVVEGKVKYRDGKKWKCRWCVLKKPSPVADRLQLVLYKDVHEALRAGGKVKSSFPLDGYYGLESGFSLDRETNVLAVLCQKQISLLAFDTREYLIQFEVKIRRSMGQEYQFPVRVVKVPSGSRVPLEGVKLLIHGCRFCLTAQVPPRILQTWNVADLRRYGAVDGKFCFEGGSKCGKGVGVHAVQTEQAEEITEILRVNSLGKSSTAQSSNNRNSQLLDYSLVTPDSVWSQDRAGGLGSGPGASAVGADHSPRLGCCQGLPAGGEVDEWGCRKRHSVNVTEYQRASVATFQEKLRQMSLESQERQRLMAIYDVPPKHPRKLETVSDSGSTHQSKEDESAASSVDPLSGTDISTPEFKATSGLMVRLDPDTAASQGEVGQSPAASQSRRVIVTSVAGREYCIPRSLNTSVFDSIVNAQVDTTKRKEALQSLHKQESHLRQEIDLLDQMLKICHPQSEERVSQTLSDEESTTDSMDPWQERIATLEPPLQCSTPNHVAKKTASLPPKIGSGEDAEKEEPANSPLSPNLLSKLEKIPWNSSLNAPLPYVNLAKYDAETDSGFIYLQGGSEADSGYMAAAPKLHKNPAGGSMASLRHRALMGVPSRSFSETHIGPGNVAGCSLVAPQKPLPLPPKEESEEELQSDLSPSGDSLVEDDDLSPPTTYAPPVPYPRVLTTMSSSSASTSVTDSSQSEYTPLATASTPLYMKPVLIREPIYANEPPPLPPPRCKPNTPPPELPPKGPALLQRSKLRSSGSGASITTTVPPPPPVRTRSLSVGSQGGRASECDKPGSGSPPVGAREVKKSSGEQAYLPMGSPQSPARRLVTDSSKAGDSRPSSLCMTSSPKPRSKGSAAAAAATRRGNAEVLSGYMDMANMFVEEPKHDPVDNASTSGSEPIRELYISEPIGESSSEVTVDSNYMEMSNFPVQPKSTVLKNLETLQSYISITSAGEGGSKSGSSSSPGTPRRSNTANSSDVPTPSTPPTKASCKARLKVTTSNTTSSSDDNIFSISSVETEDVSTNKSRKSAGSSGTPNQARPAIPFTNLKNFEQKQSKSYVNTYIPAPEVPLPEPPKKEEGFFARLMRRNSKDKSTSKSQESLNQQKNRTSVFERSISEQSEVVDEKSPTKLKAGRRRSASFPNRLSFHETTSSEGVSSTPKTDAPPPLPPSIKSSSSVRSSLSTKSSSSVKSVSSLKSSPSTKSCSSSSTKSSSKQSRTNLGNVNSKAQPDNRSDNSSLQDLSDDSDRAPLLRQGGSSNSELRVLTVLHVQQELNVSPMAQICTRLTSCSSSDPLFTKYGDSCSSKLSDSSVSLSDCSKAASSNSSKIALSDCSKTTLSDSSRTELSDSSKTDDEKLIELLKSGQRPSAEVDEVSFQANTTIDQQSTTNAQEEAAAIARHVASVPPLIPPKSKRLPLSPVSEVSSPGTLSLSTPSPSSPPQHPLLPSAPNQDEAIYMDMKELLPQPQRGSASASAAHLHPYNCPREQKERARATLRITPAVEDEEGNIWVPRHDAGEVRSRSVQVFESTPPVPSLSSKLPPAFTHRSPRLGGEALSSPFELRYTTPLVVSVDPLEGAGEGLAEPLSVSSQGSCPSLRSLDDAIIRASPAATVLRPRSGRDYQVVERRRLGSESLSSSSATQSPTYSSVFTYEASPLPHKSPASHSLFSWQSQETASPCQPMSTGPSTPLSRERTPPTPSSASLSVSKELAPSPRVHARRDTPLPLPPPRKVRPCHRAHSEPWSGRTDFPRIVCHSTKSSPPSTPQAPISPLALAPETPQPALNYAEIDLTAMASTPPPVELTRQFSRRQKKVPPKAVAIEYTQIDHTATTALKKAGQEHAQSREDNNSLRRGAIPISLARKNSAPATTKDRKHYSSFAGERKLSTCSMDSI